jgi:hypothetical protein
MSSAEIIAVVEGKTEKTFVDEVLAPALWDLEIYMRATILKKPGQSGGDVKFARVHKDIGNHLKHRDDTYVTLLVDFYGIHSKWPELDAARAQRTPHDKARCFTDDLMERILASFPERRPDKRFIPYVAMHEFEAMLFSNPEILADAIGVNESDIKDILNECGEPENINDSSSTAPSKRLQSLSLRFKKTTTGIDIAKRIGVGAIRQACPLFDQWLKTIESL